MRTFRIWVLVISVLLVSALPRSVSLYRLHWCVYVRGTNELWRHPRILPSIGNNPVGYPLHGPQLLVYLRHGRGVAVEDGRAVVVRVVVWG